MIGLKMLASLDSHNWPSMPAISAPGNLRSARLLEEKKALVSRDGLPVRAHRCRLAAGAIVDGGMMWRRAAEDGPPGIGPAGFLP